MNKMDEVLVDDQYPVEINTATAEPGNVAIHSDLHTNAIPENPNTLTNESNETSSSNVDSNDLSVDKDYIQIQIRFTNGTGEIIHSRLQETVGVLKSYFENDFSITIIRLIFDGKLLEDDDATLGSCGLHNDCIVLCMIHHLTPSLEEYNHWQSQQSEENNPDDLDQELENIADSILPGTENVEEVLIFLSVHAVMFVIMIFRSIRFWFITWNPFSRITVQGVFTVIVLFVLFFICLWESWTNDLTMLKIMP